jgi:hypothetical protein
MPELKEIEIASDFSPVPAGRYIGDGKYTGQEFREKLVEPRLREGKSLRLNLDGVESLPSSFWEEVFGGLVRQGFRADELHSRINLFTSEDILRPYVMLAWKFVDEESRRSLQNSSN